LNGRAEVVLRARAREARAGQGDVACLDGAARLETDQGPPLSNLEYPPFADLCRAGVGSAEADPGARPQVGEWSGVDDGALGHDAEDIS
jgi:hypothetical protein